MPKLKDEVRYCERCGISFLWTSEEQKQLANAGGGTTPTRCPGCRHLLPAQGRERGVVKWFNLRKQYGFIVRRNQPEIYVHSSDVQSPAKLDEGDLVEFNVVETPRGLAAQQVQLIHSPV
jgi:CspA family cold shock protein